MSQESLARTAPGYPDIRIFSENTQERLLDTISYGMIDLIQLARPRELRDVWATDDYHRITESSNLYSSLNKVTAATNVVKLIAQSPELNLLECAGSLAHSYGFKKIRDERKKNQEVRPSEPSVPFSSFELMLYRQIAVGTEYDYWKYEAEITQNLADAFDANAADAWKIMQQFGLDMLIPAVSHIQRNKRAAIARYIKQEMSRDGNQKTGCEIFCDALAQNGIESGSSTSVPVAERFRRTMQLLPQLYAYKDRTIPEDEPQQDEYYQHVAIALAYYSAVRGSGPFGAVLRIGSTFIGATNEWNEGKKDYDHAERVLLNNQAANEFGDPQLKGFVLYTTAEPCFDCVLPIRDNNRALEAVHIGIPTSMGSESVYGLLSAGHLTHLHCGPPPKIVWGVLENEARGLYNYFMGWYNLVPSKAPYA